MFHARELMKLLRKLTDELALTTIMVVHDINIAAAYADTIIAMKDGGIKMIGTPKEIITTENLKTVFNLDAEVLECPRQTFSYSSYLTFEDHGN
ncbi:Hemin import ATP-binding protein HmuV [Mannheimia haemolytica]|uniref:Hemin import ATP-binding protein HmuV n=1 Tax=Mannheimia haemolytica TaxID=75985 RepID=A0A378N6G1_MANHA|nr:Hemin import ATP-binding protein HmuV [Mannheimia haemolytica]